VKLTSTAVSAAIIFAGLVLGYVYRAATFPPVYAIIFFSFFLGGLLIAQSIKRPRWVVHNLAFVFLALATAELYFGFNATDISAAYPHVMQQDGLGHGARPGTFRAVKKYGFGTGVVYDVQYSIDKNGFRVAPDSLKQSGPTVMFFGDSFTFGEGVNDEDTLPNAFSILSGMRVLNFGIGGYGPHQMLRLLELDVPRKVTADFPYLMVYTALEYHIGRAAGLSEWDKNGPLYEVENEHACYVGSFSEHNVACVSFARPIIDKLLVHSRIWQAETRTGQCRAPSDKDALKRDRMRFLEIVKAANVIAQQKYHSRLVVILWDDARARGDAAKNISWIEAKLLENNIATLKLSSKIKDDNFKNFFIRRDGHPNQKAYRMVAEILLSWLKENPTILPSVSHFSAH
jgi:hypothetical protein